MNEEPAVKRFLGRLGDVFDRMGSPPIAGRIFGWLLICEPEEQDAAGIAEAAGASPASVSTLCRMLMRSGLIERRAQRGSRKHLYRLRDDAFHEFLLARLATVSELVEAADEGLDAIGHSGGRARRLREMRDLYAFFAAELPSLIRRYERRRGE